MQFKIKILFSVVFTFCINGLIAQNSINGVLLDSTTKEPIAYANVYLKSEPSIGVASNELGEFSINIPQNFENDTICLSAIGYNQKFVPISNLIGRIYDKVFILNSSIYLIESVSVSAPSEYARNLVKEAVELIQKNYNKRRHIQSGIFREISLQDSINISVVEADIRILDQGTGKSADRVRIAINKLRRNDDNRHPYQKSKSFQTIGKVLKKSNEIYNIYGYNFFKKLDGDIQWFDEAFIAKRNFYLKGNYVDSGDTILIINFTAKSNKIFLNEDGFVYINKHDKAIVKIEYTNSFSADDRFYRLQTFFKNTDGLYYPRIIKKENLFPNKLFSQSLIAIIYVSDRREEFKAFRKMKKTTRTESIYDLKYNYDEEFWNNYAAIQLLPIDEWQKLNSEKLKNIDYQFKNPK